MRKGRTTRRTRKTQRSPRRKDRAPLMLSIVFLPSLLHPLHAVVLTMELFRALLVNLLRDSIDALL